MKKIMILAALFVLGGCASTIGVVPIGKDTYMIACEDNGPAASFGAIKAATFKEAVGFCASQGKAFQIKKDEGVISFV